MSFIVEQKIKGKIYLYEVESYWDKEAKKAKQRRKYIGRKKDDIITVSLQNLKSFSSLGYGDIFLLQSISEQIGLSNVLKQVFNDAYLEVLAIAMYEICDNSPVYLFQNWLEEHYLPEVKKIDSSAISKLFDSIGQNEKQTMNFLHQWIVYNNSVKAVYYDITSISSYSTNLDFIEWGYNRDSEDLPQVNLGIVCNKDNSLPLYYSIYQGSIVDVSTLKNTLTYLKQLGLNEFLCIMDRGFYSNSNVLEMNKKDDIIEFIQPVSFTNKNAKELVRKNKLKLNSAYNAFLYNEEIIYYTKDEFELNAQNKFEAHLFYNEKNMINSKQLFLTKIIEFHEKLEKMNFNTAKDFNSYKKNEMKASFREYFRWHKFNKKVERNNKAIERALTRLGTFILISNKKGLDNQTVLNYYRQKDGVEKLFDSLKNELDTQRLRTHNEHTTKGKIFIKFISLILYSAISQTMKEKKLFKKYTIKELLAEIKKVKINQLGNNQPILSEISKRQNDIFSAFNISCKI